MPDAWDQFQDAPASTGSDPWAEFQDAPDATAATAVPQQPQTPTGDALDAVIEPAMSMGSSALATPVAGLAGIGTAIGRGIGLTDAEPADVVRRIQEAGTYQPRTRAGQAATGIVSYPFEKLTQGADWLGQKTTDVTGSPALGAAVNTAAQVVAPTAIFKGAKGIKGRLDGNRGAPNTDGAVAPRETAPTPEAASQAERPAGLARVSDEPVPTRAELAEAAKAAYKRADEAGVVVSENSLKGLKTRVVALTKKEGIDRDLHPDSSAVLKRVVQAKGNLTLTELETLRKVAKDAQGSLKPADKRLASMIVDELDDYIDNIGGADVVAGDATKVKALKEARGLYSRAKKSEVIDDLMQRAQDSASQFSGSGLENAIRTQFRGLAKNKKQMRMFTADEQAAIRKVANGGPIENTARFIGKFAPTGVVSGVLSGGAGAMIGGPLGAALPLAGLGGRAVATRLTKRNVRAADELMRRGPAGSNQLAKQTAERKRNALADF